MSCVTWCDYAGVIPDKEDPDSLVESWDITVATFSNWFRNEVLGMFSGTAPTYKDSGQYYIACCSTASTSETPGIELSGSNYSRTPITFERVSDIQRWNPATLNSQLASAQWDPILSFTLWDAAEGGNYYAFGNLAVTLTVEQNKAVQWPANRVIIGLGTVIG